MRIAILGTRGIPNTYGGFEQFAEYLSVGLVECGHSVTVYNTSFHSYTENIYKGVEIRRVYSPEKTIGASANFIYDFLCLRDALKDNFDIIYELGYHSNAPSYYLLKKHSPVVITNMDGLEWKRSKWGTLTRKLIRKLENLAVRKSGYLISDNPAIQDYYLKEFGRKSFFIPYGADVVDDFNADLLSLYKVAVNDYFLLIARLEPENNIEMILDGFKESGSKIPFLVIGHDKTKYGKYLSEKYTDGNVSFLGSIYDKNILDNLRHFSKLYFHGHSVGGTNPSLLEAMASQTLLAAHDNLFNRAVLGNDAFYFRNKNDVCLIMNDSIESNLSCNSFVENNLKKIEQKYSWNKIICQYDELFSELLKTKSE